MSDPSAKSALTWLEKLLARWQSPWSCRDSTIVIVFWLGFPRCKSNAFRLFKTQLPESWRDHGRLTTSHLFSNSCTGSLLLNVSSTKFCPLPFVQSVRIGQPTWPIWSVFIVHHGVCVQPISLFLLFLGHGLSKQSVMVRELSLILLPFCGMPCPGTSGRQTRSLLSAAPLKHFSSRSSWLSDLEYGNEWVVGRVRNGECGVWPSPLLSFVCVWVCMCIPSPSPPPFPIALRSRPSGVEVFMRFISIHSFIHSFINRVFPKRMRRTIESPIHIHVRSLSNLMVALTSLPVSRHVSHFDQKMLRILEWKNAQTLDTAGHSGWGKCHGNVIYQNSIKGRTLLRCPSVKTENGVDKSL